jgi:hypothetical protein
MQVSGLRLVGSNQRRSSPARTESRAGAGFVVEEFSEVPHSPGPMRQGFLCTDQVASRPVVHKTLILPSGCIMAPPGVGPSDRGYGVVEPYP